MGAQYLDAKSHKLLGMISEEMGASGAQILARLIKATAISMAIFEDDEVKPEPETKAELSAALRFRVTVQERAALEAEAKKTNKTFSDVLRKLIRTHLTLEPTEFEKPKAQDAPVIDPMPEGDEQKRAARFHLSVTGREKAILEAITAKTGLKRNTVLLSILRGYALNTASFTYNEIEVLHGLKNHLQAIGRNLNQMARALNASPTTEADKVKIEQIQELAKAVKMVAETINKKTKPMFERWGCIA